VHWVCTARFWNWEGYRGGFCGKLLEPFPMSDRANASRLQDGPTAGQGRASQRGGGEGEIAAGERSETIQEQQLCRHQGQGRRRARRCSRHSSRGSSAARREEHVEAGCPPAAHGGPWWSRCPPVAYGGPTLEQEDVPKRVCDPMGSLAAGSWQDLQTHGDRSPRWSRFAGRACDPMEDRRWSSLFLKY